MQRMLVIVILAVACHHEVKQQVQLDTTEHTDSKEKLAEVTGELKVQAASDIDTKVSSEQDAVIISMPDGGVQIARIEPKKPLVLPKGSKVIGTVPLSKTQTEQDKHIGGSTETDSKALTDIKKKVDDKVGKLKSNLDDVTDTGPGFKFYCFLLLGIALVLAGGYCYLKFIKKAVLP